MPELYRKQDYEMVPQTELVRLSWLAPILTGASRGRNRGPVLGVDMWSRGMHLSVSLTAEGDVQFVSDQLSQTEGIELDEAELGLVQRVVGREVDQPRMSVWDHLEEAAE